MSAITDTVFKYEKEIAGLKQINRAMVKKIKRIREIMNHSPSLPPDIEALKSDRGNFSNNDDLLSLVAAIREILGDTK